MLVAKEILRSAVLRKKRYKAIRFFRINLTLTNISLSVSYQTIAKIKISHSWISLTFKRIIVGLTRSRKILRKRRNRHHFYSCRILVRAVLPTVQDKVVVSSFRRPNLSYQSQNKTLRKDHQVYRSRILINWVLWINIILDMLEATKLSHMWTHFPITSCAKWKMLSSSNCWIREIISANQDLCPKWSSALPHPKMTRFRYQISIMEALHPQMFTKELLDRIKKLN